MQPWPRPWLEATLYPPVNWPTGQGCPPRLPATIWPGWWMVDCLRWNAVYATATIRLASPAVAEILESLMALSGPPILKNRPDRTAVDPSYQARSCYDHLAGSLAVVLADTLRRNGWISL